MGQARVNVEELQLALAAEIARMRSGVEWVRWLDGATTHHGHSFRNVVLINLQMPEASWVAGRETWRRLGRRVRGAESGIRVLSPMSIRPTAPATSRPHDRGVATVWDLTQTDGPPILPPTQSSQSVGSVTRLWETLTRVAEGAGFKVRRGRTRNELVEAHTDYLRRHVVVSDRLDGISAVTRLAHELAHVRMHDPGDTTRSGSIMCRGMREVEAESVSYTLLAHHGIPTGGSTFRYVARWASAVDKDRPDKVIEHVGGRVVYVARKLIEAVDRHTLSNERWLGRGASMTSSVVEFPNLTDDTVSRDPATHGLGL